MRIDQSSRVCMLVAAIVAGSWLAPPMFGSSSEPVVGDSGLYAGTLKASVTEMEIAPEGARPAVGERVAALAAELASTFPRQIQGPQPLNTQPGPTLSGQPCAPTFTANPPARTCDPNNVNCSNKTMNGSLTCHNVDGPTCSGQGTCNNGSPTCVNQRTCSLYWGSPSTCTQVGTCQIIGNGGPSCQANGNTCDGGRTCTTRMTCIGGNTCQGNTCIGATCINATCNFNNAGLTCDPAAQTCGGNPPTCDNAVSCRGSQKVTCDQMYTCDQNNTCVGIGNTCADAPTCRGRSTCGQTNTCGNIVGTCSGTLTCIFNLGGPPSGTCVNTEVTCDNSGRTCNVQGTCAGTTGYTCYQSLTCEGASASYKTCVLQANCSGPPGFTHLRRSGSGRALLAGAASIELIDLYQSMNCDRHWSNRVYGYEMRRIHAAHAEAFAKRPTLPPGDAISGGATSENTKGRGQGV